MCPRGGARPGAGRRKGGRYGEETKAVRIPVSRLEDVLTLIDNKNPLYRLPLFTSKVPAGFPSPADDDIECGMDLNEHLIRHPSATFFVKASGDSMKNAGIASGDLLIVDRSLEPAHGKIVIAAVNGELTVKRLSSVGGRVQLLPENPQYAPIDIPEGAELVIWGVVTHVIHETV